MAKQIENTFKKDEDYEDYIYYENTFPLYRLLATDNEFDEFKFPHTKDKFKFDKTFRHAPKYSNKIRKYALLSIDCEMVGTIKGQELARISIVDIYGNIIYDKYIKPYGKIINYRTKYGVVLLKIL